MKIQISTSADKSGIIRQLQELKVDNSNEGTGIRNMLLGTEAAFTYEGPKNFRASIPKPISATYKRKYPDLVFALHALRLHLGGNTYYREWEKAKKK